MRALRRSMCSVVLGAALTACSSEVHHDPPFEPEIDEPGTLRGQLTVHLANFDDGTMETRYFLRDAEGVNHRLVVRGTIDVAPGSTIKIRGARRDDDAIDLASYEPVREEEGRGPGSQSQPLIDGGPTSSRFLCAGIVEVNGGTPKITSAVASSAFHMGPTSVNAFLLENSYGKLGLGGGVYGPFQHSMTGCDYMGLATAIRPMIDASAPAKCDHYAFIFGPAPSECGWSALPQFGTRDAPATDTWLNDSVSCVVAVQEPSHNYGLSHSSSVMCGASPFADDLSSCTHSEYGDKYDAMGSGCYHMNGWHKLYQRWFGGCNGVSTSSSGTFYLQSLERPCDGVQVMRVTFPAGKTRAFQNTTLTSYYLELRTAFGFDAKVGASRVFIHAGGDPPLPDQLNAPGLHTWLVNASGVPTVPGLTAGKTFTDPAGGLTIRVQSIEETRATVNIEYAAGVGTPHCLDGSGSPFLPPGPEWCGPDGGTGGTGGAGGAGGSDVGGSGGVGGIGGRGGGGTGGTCGLASARSGCSGTAGVGAGGSVTGGTSGTGGAGTSGSGGTGTGGTTGGSGGVGTGTGGSSGGNGGTSGSAGEGGTGSGGDAGRGGSDGDPTGGPAGDAGSRAAGGTSGTSGAGASGTSGGGFDRDASSAGAAGTDDDFGQRRGACSCRLPARGDWSSRSAAALAAFGVIAVWRRRRVRLA